MFKKLSDATQFSTEKMKKNGIFETERFFCDLYCFEPGQVQAPHAHRGLGQGLLRCQGKGCFKWGTKNESWEKVRSRMAPSGQNHGVANRSAEQLVRASLHGAQTALH